VARYQKQAWQDNDPTKPASAARMTHLEDGLDDADRIARRPPSLGFTFGNGADAIVAASEPAQEFWTDADWDVTGWVVSADAAGDVVLRVDKAAAAAFPGFTEVLPADRPTLAAARLAQDDAMASPLAGRQARGRTCWRATVVSAATVKRVALTLTGAFA
jgi:hypothetical protein